MIKIEGMLNYQIEVVKYYGKTDSCTQDLIWQGFECLRSYCITSNREN